MRTYFLSEGRAFKTRGDLVGGARGQVVDGLGRTTGSATVSADAGSVVEDGTGRVYQVRSTGRAALEAVAGLAILAVVAGTMYGLLSGWSGPQSGADPCAGSHAAAQALSAVQGAARDQLRSPGSARFGHIPLSYHGDCRWSAAGQVDAQNGFGALQRLGFVASVRLDQGRLVTERLEWTGR